MDYTPAKVRNASADFVNMLCIPHQLPGFMNSSTELVRVKGGREAYVFHGDILYDQPWCTVCGSKMEAHQHLHTRLRHLPFGPYSEMQFPLPARASTRSRTQWWTAA